MNKVATRARDTLRRLVSPKIAGILALLVVVCVYTAVASENFLKVNNLGNVVHRTALFGILSIGVAFVIITGGIDLSIGSVVCLVGVLLPWLVVEHAWNPALAVGFLLALGAAIGLAHGLMITKLGLQPFVVTLCGLLIYRGVARGLTHDQSQGFGTAFKGLRSLATTRFPIFGEGGFRLPATTIIFLVIAVVAAVVLNLTVFGRYLFALGRNEQAARYSGIHTDRMKLFAYVISSTLAALGGMLFVLYLNVAQPSDFGNFYELYAIAAAVLGGCSLRGGEGSIFGLLVGSALIVVLSNMINLVHDRYQSIEFAIIGGVILAGVVADEVVRRLARRRPTA
jgi:ribose transport system permease protein